MLPLDEQFSQIENTASCVSFEILFKIVVTRHNQHPSSFPRCSRTSAHLFSTQLSVLSLSSYIIIISYLYSSLSPGQPPFLFPSFTCSHLHNIVAGDSFHLFSIRLEGVKITLPVILRSAPSQGSADHDCRGPQAAESAHLETI